MGFQMREVMTGHHEFEPGQGEPGRHFMEFRVNWGTDHLRDWANPTGDRFMVNELEGTVTVEGLVQNAPCRGTLEMRYFTEGSIRYTFEFTVGDTVYQYVGRKVHIRPWNLPWSHTTCFGRLTKKETGELVSISLTHFRLRTALSFLGSFRLRG
jgi:hypothetical protein